MINIKNFSKISKKDVSEVGGKGASLGEMLSAGFPVPPGFVIVAELNRKFVDGDISADIVDEILKAFDSLGVSRVAVRSSAIAEDSSQASWAGQLESYLNVDRKNLISKIKECWNSIKSERALQYASQQNLPREQLLVAVVVQAMIASEVSDVYA
ncbi:MAG: ppsA [Candidatus Levybacteria bacterium]|nr:ppsA [Candidatus Levybacteria bacterium]